MSYPCQSHRWFKLSATDKILDKLGTDIADRITKAKSDINALTPTVVPTLSDDFSTPWKLTTDGQKSPDGKWVLKYLSGGVAESINGVLHMAPAPSTASNITRASELHTTQIFKNFQLDFNARTNKQLRQNSTPNPWEVFWIFFRYTDEAPKSNHHMYFYLGINGFEFGKKDNKPTDPTLEQQIFLKTGSLPKVRLGVTNHFTIIAQGFHYTIKIDGVTVIDMTDPVVNDPAKMTQGLIGMYAEDSDFSVDNVKVMSLP